MSPCSESVPIRLLLIEDNPGDARLVREHLADVDVAQSFAVTIAPSLAEARIAGTRDPFDIVLLDLSLPDSFGLETLAQWQLVAPELPVIVLTGSDDEALAVAAVREGAQDYLVKGRIDGAVLVQAIRYAIERKHVQEDLENAKADLERRVEERTAELLEINGRLQSEIAERTLAQQQAAVLLKREQEARQQVENANRSKDEFLAVLSHELRTPLNAILGWVEILHGESTPAEVQEGVAIIERNARAQARLVEDVLEVSRIICGKVRLNLAEVDIAGVVSAAVDNARPAAAARGVQLQQTEAAQSMIVSGDTDRLQQVFSNLLSNAIKFTPAGGTVRVETQALAGGRAAVRVTDTGTGIKADFLPFVFDRFRQSDSSTTRNHGGLGLGLSITRHLAQLHGGSIEAFSRGEGLGSTFTVSLPLQGSAKNSRQTGSAAAPCPNVSLANGSKHPLFDLAALHHRKVLVVDDEPDSRTMVVRLLRRACADVREAGSAQEGWRTLDLWEADLLISDIAMPGEDGYSLLRRLRSSDQCRLRNLPAIALTAFARPEDAQLATEAGFTMHLAKPIEPGTVLAAAAALCAQQPVHANP